MSQSSSAGGKAAPHGARLSKTPHGEPLLCEVGWEVCQQLGGIYTVLRSKAPFMTSRWGERYCLLGPYDPETSRAEFEETEPTGPFAEAIRVCREKGFGIRHGVWLISGRPRVILFDPATVFPRLAEIKYLFWQHHDISTLAAGDPLLDRVFAFGYMAEHFLRTLSDSLADSRPVIAHFHEWMAGTAIPELRRSQTPIAIVFTTHATLLGRYIAPNDPWFYDHLPFVDWLADARRYAIEPQVRLERAAAHGAHVFTTVGEITALECEQLVGRRPDVLLPNGLNIERFVALHEFQNLHRLYRDKLHQFVMGHFFPSYTFDLDRTLYFFTTGRYEYRNKGFDLTIEALARLNWRLRQQPGLNRTIVFFLVTRRPYRSVHAEALHNRALLEEIRNTSQAIKEEVGQRLFLASAQGQTPPLDELLSDYWRLRLRRIIYDWKTDRLPDICTHELLDEGRDEVMAQLRACQLTNQPDSPVKVVYHPEFIAPTDPLFGMDYDHFVRGCHLGIFPSNYEPWGYTAPECMARGIPAVTSDLSGFGTYLLKNMPDHRQRGVFVVGRRLASFDAAANELTNWLFNFIQLERRDRIALRNSVENASHHFDWSNLGQHYDTAHRLALEEVAR